MKSKRVDRQEQKKKKREEQKKKLWGGGRAALFIADRTWAGWQRRLTTSSFDRKEEKERGE